MRQIPSDRIPTFLPPRRRLFKQTNKMNSLYLGVFMAIMNMGLYGLNQCLGSNQEKVYLNACHLTWDEERGFDLSCIFHF